MSGGGFPWASLVTKPSAAPTAAISVPGLYNGGSRDGTPCPALAADADGYTSPGDLRAAAARERLSGPELGEVAQHAQSNVWRAARPQGAQALPRGRRARTAAATNTRRGF